MQLVIISVPYAQIQGRIKASNAPATWQEAGLVERLAPYVERAIWVSLPPAGESEAEQPSLLAIGRQLAETVRTVRAGGALPLVLGGDGLLNALGAIMGLQNQQEQLGIAWFDAHSNLAHNQMLSLLVGWGDPSLAQELGFQEKVKEWNVLLAGVRTLSPLVSDRLDNSLMSVWTTKDIQGWGQATELGRGMDDWPPVYLHLDLSVLDPKQMPAVQDPQPEGLAIQTLITGIEAVAAASQVIGLSVGNFDPRQDQNGLGLHTSSQLIEAAVRILAI